MDNNGVTDRGGKLLQALLIALGLIVGGWVLGAQIKATRLSDRYVTVKGLAERSIKSDLAIWSLDYKEAGDDLAEPHTKSENDKNAILQFLNQQGLQASGIELGIVHVVDERLPDPSLHDNPLQG